MRITWTESSAAEAPGQQDTMLEAHAGFKYP